MQFRRILLTKQKQIFSCCLKMIYPNILSEVRLKIKCFDLDLMRRLVFSIVLLFLLWVAHHIAVYVHEWTHASVAWAAGYKNSPFAIHYGTEWVTLWDIHEDVPYENII